MTANAPQVVTRFAPSPTGYLHVGGARTALFCWLLARHHGGRYLLRIEDTDLARSTQAAVDALLEDLKWLGLEHDNAELIYQSRRLHVYNALIERLIADGKAYKAYETPEELDALRDAAKKQKRDFIYRRPQLTDEQIRQYESEGRGHVVRFVMPVKDYSFHDDALQKDVSVSASQVQDFVIRKRDGMPTYHFGVVVDDHEMGITHVLRGQEHLLNTINHIGLQEALGYQRPIYCHLPIIMNLDGSKMGKRDRDKKVRERTALYYKTLPGHERASRLAEELIHNAEHRPELECFGQFQNEILSSGLVPTEYLDNWLNDSSRQISVVGHLAVMHVIHMSPVELPEILVYDFRKNGYLPEALLNFLALLGWNPGGDREHMTMSEMAQAFGIDGVGKSNAKFDRQKLLAFNTAHNAAASPARLLGAMRKYLEVNPDSSLNRATDDQLSQVLAMKPGFRSFREIDEASRFMLLGDEEISYAPDAVEKVLKKNNEGVAVLRDLKDILAKLDQWTHDSIEAAVKAYCDAKQLGLGKVAQPIRVAVSGGTISPPIFHSLTFIGKAASLARIDRCLKQL
jgi:glutamyl-tRNA synthetase